MTNAEKQALLDLVLLYIKDNEAAEIFPVHVRLVLNEIIGKLGGGSFAALPDSPYDNAQLSAVLTLLQQTLDGTIDLAEAAAALAQIAKTRADDAYSLADYALTTALDVDILAGQALAVGQGAQTTATLALQLLDLLTPPAVPVDQTQPDPTSVDMSKPNQFRAVTGALVWSTLSNLGRAVPVNVLLTSSAATDTFKIGSVTLTKDTPNTFLSTINGQQWTVNLIGTFLEQMRQRVTLLQHNTLEMTLEFNPHPA